MKIRLLKEIEITKGKKLKPGTPLEVDNVSGRDYIKYKKAEDRAGEMHPILKKDIDEGYAKPKEEKKAKKKDK